MIKIVFFSLALLGAVWNNAAVAGMPVDTAQTPEQARSIAEQRTDGGRVLAVEETNSGYRVKVLTADGKVIFVFVERR